MSWLNLINLIKFYTDIHVILYLLFITGLIPGKPILWIVPYRMDSMSLKFHVLLFTAMTAHGVDSIGR